MWRRLAVCLSGFALISGVGCVSTPPINEYVLAQTALNSARESGAEQWAPAIWHTAEDHYRKAQKALKDNDNELAKKNFLKSLELSEKAENISRIKKFETGEVFQ